MISLESFLKRRKPKVNLTVSNFLSIIYGWKDFCQLDNSLHRFINKEKYVQHLENLFDSILQAIQDPIHGIENEKFSPEMWVKFLDLKMDYFRSMMIDIIRLNSKDSPFLPPIRLTKKTSGVGIDAFIRESESKIIDFRKTQRNLLQDRNTDKKFTKDVKSLFSKLSFIRRDTIKQVIGNELLHTRDYHAELLWMAYQGNHFLEKLMAILPQQEKPDTTAMDLNWVSHFSVYPRIEFVLCSSCCVSCQQYFKDLRHYLNENNVFVPIVIYSGMPTNSVEVTKSQMNLVLFDETFLSTGIYIETPYDSKADRKYFDFFKPINTQRAEVCEEVMSEAIAYLNIHQHAEYQKQLIIGLEQMFVDKTIANQTDLAWLRSFLVRWPDGFYENQAELHKQVLEKIETECQEVNNQNMPSLKDLKQKLKSHVYAWIHQKFEEEIEEIDELLDETIDEALNKPSYNELIWEQVFPVLFILVIYLIAIKIKERTTSPDQILAQRV